MPVQLTGPVSIWDHPILTAWRRKKRVSEVVEALRVFQNDLIEAVNCDSLAVQEHCFCRCVHNKPMGK